MSRLLEQSIVSSEELEELLRERAEGKVDFLLIDVREDMEYKISHIVGVDLLKPTSAFQDWGDGFLRETKDQIVIFTCRTDFRSGRIQNSFKQNGHTNVLNHSGGIVSYRGEIERG
ncbi:MAG: rhodanese-like domain-containing protein [Campylobacterota bacterium]|nr:rhodanese-like domain-containing protein [Campylobacterota bacterium]